MRTLVVFLLLPVLSLIVSVCGHELLCWDNPYDGQPAKKTKCNEKAEYCVVAWRMMPNHQRHDGHGCYVKCEKPDADDGICCCKKDFCNKDLEKCQQTSSAKTPYGKPPSTDNAMPTAEARNGTNNTATIASPHVLLPLVAIAIPGGGTFMNL